MTEEQIIKKQTIKNTLLNLMAFTIIFTILGIILYMQISSSIYRSSDEELQDLRNRQGILESLSQTEETKNEVVPKDKIEPPQDDKNHIQNINPNNQVNPRLVYIVRNSDGDTLKCSEQIEKYEDIDFDKNNLNKIYNIIVNKQYSYRTITYVAEQDGETIYIQLMINVDAEESILQNFTITLIISITISIIISIIISYLLSKKTMKPIITAWNKQTEFVQNASHELRTPLTIIQAKQELLLESPESKIIDKAEDISLSLSETRRMSKMIKELMQLARADTNKIEINKTRINIDEMITSMTEPYKEMCKEQGKELSLNLNYNKEIDLDENKIKQVIIIILDNSIKYTEKGDSITIETKEKDGKLLLDIKDTGMGMSDETIKRAFERFYREDKARSRTTGGTGLGLSIANMIINAHGGSIKALHNEPKGTIIEIKLKT